MQQTTKAYGAAYFAEIAAQFVVCKACGSEKVRGEACDNCVEIDTSVVETRQAALTEAIYATKSHPSEFRLETAHSKIVELEESLVSFRQEIGASILDAQAKGRR